MGDWALILGASSGFGEATSLALAEAGFDIFGAHLDRRQTMHNVERITGQIKEKGREAHFFNINAADPEKVASTLDEIKGLAGGRPIRVLMHSLAFGALKPLIGDSPAESITVPQIEMTLNVMATSLVFW